MFKTSEHFTYSDLQDIFEEYLDEDRGPIILEGAEYSYSFALKMLNSNKFEIMFEEWRSSRYEYDEETFDYKCTLKEDEYD